MSINSTGLILLPGAGEPDYNRGPAIIAAVTITTVLALAIVLLRLWVRVTMVRSVGSDVRNLSKPHAQGLRLTRLGLRYHWGHCKATRSSTCRKLISISFSQSSDGSSSYLK